MTKWWQPVERSPMSRDGGWPPGWTPKDGVYAEEWVLRVMLVTTLNQRWEQGWERIDMIPSPNGVGRPGPEAWVLYKRRGAT